MKVVLSICIQARSIQDAARKALDVVSSQAGAPEAGTAKPVFLKKQPFSTKKGWKNTAAVKTLLDPASSDFASWASLAAEGDDLPQSFKHDSLTSKRGAPSDRSGSVAGEEPGSGAQSHTAAGLEPDAEVQDELGNFSKLNGGTFGNCRCMLLAVPQPRYYYLYNFLTCNCWERTFASGFFFSLISLQRFSA